MSLPIYIRFPKQQSPAQYTSKNDKSTFVIDIFIMHIFVGSINLSFRFIKKITENIFFHWLLRLLYDRSIASWLLYQFNPDVALNLLQLLVDFCLYGCNNDKRMNKCNLATGWFRRQSGRSVSLKTRVPCLGQEVR